MKSQSPSTPAQTSPVPLIEWDSEDHRWITNQDGLNWLRTAPRNMKVIVVAGTLRTGKSYLLNEMAQIPHEHGFPLGSELKGKTRGIWIFVRGDTVFLDTEGMFDPEMADPDRDAALFTFSILLGSYFVLNTQGVINELQIQQLNLLTQITNNIHLHKNEVDDGSQLHLHFPPFFWLLRDFSLGWTADIHSAKEYLESVLKLRNGRTPQILTHNAIRDAIRDFFPQRDCAVLPTPTSIPKDLQNLGAIPKERINKEFLEKLPLILQHILRNAPIKGIKNSGGAQILHPDGQQLADYLISIVDSINQGGLVGIEDNWIAVSRATCERALTKALQALDENSIIEAMPLEAVDLEDRLIRCFNEGILSFQTLSLGPLKEQYEARFKDSLERRSKLLQDQNMAVSMQFCTKWLNARLEELRTRVNQAEFPSFEAYETQLKSLLKAYHTEARGPAKEDALEAKQQEQDMLNTLVQTRFQMKQAEMQAHQERMQNLALIQKTNDLEAQQARGQKQAEERHREFSEMVSRMQAEQGKSQTQFMDSIQKQRAAHDEQINKLIAEGQTERAELMKSMRQTMENNNSALEKQMKTMEATLERLKAQPPPQPPQYIYRDRGGGGGGGICSIM